MMCMLWQLNGRNRCQDIADEPCTQTSAWAVVPPHMQLGSSPCLPSPAEHAVQATSELLSESELLEAGSSHMLHM